MANLELKTASGGSVTLVPEDGVSNVTATVKHESGVLASGESISAPNSPLVKGAVNATGDAPIYACRAWVNFDGTKDVNGNASTANTARFIRASGNVASVVRDSSGIYTVNFSTAMPDAEYTFSLNAGGPSGSVSSTASQQATNTSATSISFRTLNTSGSLGDPEQYTVAIFR